MAGFIYKPSTRKGPVFLAPSASSEAPTITLPDGKVITAVRGDRAGGVYEGHDGFQWVFPREVLGQKGAKLSFGGQTQDLGDTNMSYRGSALGSLSESSKGAIGDNNFGPLSPGNIGGFGSTTADLTSEFPSPTLLNYKGNPGNFEFTDPMAFAEKFGDFNRNEIRKNFNTASDIGLKELNLELAGMQSFVPAASALKRSELSLDNVFNQDQRTRQVDATLPDARRQLREQGQRAETYARGEVPDSVTDRALELGIRSDAADLATAGGFGANSRLSGKISDLMSAKERIGLSQYGDQLLGTNVDRSANLFLAPTSYSDAGQQVKVTPSVDLGTRTANALTQVNADTLINPTNALTSVTNQRQFNATNKIGVDQFNANTDNTFKQNLFNYRVGLAGQYAGANQTAINTQIALDQQAQARDEAAKQAQKKRSSDNIGSVADLIGGLSQLGSLFGIGANTPAGNTADTNIGATPNFSTGANSGNVTFDPGVTPNPEFDTSQPFDYRMDENGNTTPEVSPYQFTDVQRAAGVQVNNAANELGVQRIAATLTPAEAEKVVQASESVSRVAGISNAASNTNTFVGNNSRGQPVYAETALLKSNDTNEGNAFVKTLKGALDPLGVFDKEDSTALDKIGTVASDANFINNLSLLYQNGDKKGFVAALTNRLGNSAIKNADLDPKDKAGLASALGLYNLYENWDRMSGAQKSLAIASAGIQGYRYAGSGKDLASREIIAATPTTPGLNVGQALNLFSSGVNVYGLVDNWDQYNTFQKVTLGTGTAAQVASTAKSLNLLGSGATNAVVPGVTAEALSAAGWTAVPQAGVGAISASSTAAVPAGYVKVASDSGKTIAIPAGNEGTFMSGLQTAGGVASIALGVKTVYDGWQGSGKSGVVNGAVGGSMIVAGLSALGSSAMAGPYAPVVAAAIIGGSILGTSTGGKKSVDQKTRDLARDTVVKVGLADKDYKVTLADGKQFDIGVDGHGQQHTARDPSKLIGRKDGKLNAYDVDYTNDLDYAASMGGISLSRLLHGGSGKAVDQMGGQLSNAAISSVGFGKDMTKENYEKVITNLRGMYAKSGLKTKTDAYQLANQAFAEKRINDSELVAMQQSFNLVFDNNSFDTAQKLMNGRWKGIEAAKDAPPKKEKTTEPTETISKGAKVISKPELTKEELRLRNAAKYRQARQEQELRVG